MGSGHLAFCSATVSMRVVSGDGDLVGNS
jgi:hypothetical protein